MNLQSPVFSSEIHAMAGEKSSTGNETEDFHLDDVVLQEDLGGWDIVPDLVFEPYFTNFVMVPYNVCLLYTSDAADE